MLEKTAQFIMGEDYEDIATFFINLYKECKAHEEKGEPVVVVFIDERDQALSVIFQNIFSKYKNCKKKDVPEYFGKDFSFKEYERIASTYYTRKENLSTIADQFATYYLEKGEFPYLIVVDEAFWHGLTVEGALSSLYYRIQKQVLEKALESFQNRPQIQDLQLQQKIKNLILDSAANKMHNPFISNLKICSRILADIKIAGFSCLKGDFERKHDVSKIPPAKRYLWLTCSCEPLLRSVSNVNNTYGWSIVREKGAPEPTTALTSYTKLIETTYRDVRQKTHFFAYPDFRHPLFLFSCQWRHSYLSPQEKENFYMGQPHIISEDIPKQNLLICFKKIISDAPEELASFLAQYSNADLNRIYEIIMLTLNGLFLKKLYGKDLSYDDLDMRILASNYVNLKEILDKNKESSRESKLKLLWDFVSTDTEQKFNSYLGILCKGITPMWDVQESKSNISDLEKNKILEVIMNELAELGFATEKLIKATDDDLFVPSSSRERRYDFLKFLKKLIKDYSITNSDAILTLIAMLLQQRELGTISVTPEMSDEENGVFMRLSTR